MQFQLASGAEARRTNPASAQAAIFVNGGQGGAVPGTWSASLEWLVERLAPRLPEIAFTEVRYRIKSWNQLSMCVEDALAALDAAVVEGARTCALVGFSMGGAVSLRAAAHPAVTTVIGLAPWFPERLSVEALRGRRLAVLHGSLDRYLPGIPGVSPANSRAGFDRARALGVEGDYTLIRGGLHGVAVRHRSGRPVPLPRAKRWAELLEEELERFQTG